MDTKRMNARQADLGGGGFDGLEGVDDDRLEALANNVSGDKSGQSHSPTQRPADPDAGARNEQQPDGAPVSAEPNLLQELGYDTEEAAIGAWRSLRNYTSQTKDELEEMKRENQALKAQLTGGGQQDTFGRMSPAAAVAARETVDPLKQLEDEFFIPRAALEPAISALVDQTLMARLQPLVLQQEADKRMTEKYGPEYGRIKPRIDAYVASNPRVAAFVQQAAEKGMPELGAEYAVTAFREAVAFATHEGIQQEAGAATSARDRGRATGAPLTSRENTRTRLAQAQAGDGSGIDFHEAIARANRGDDRMIDEVFAAQLPSEEHLDRVFRGHA